MSILSFLFLTAVTASPVPGWQDDVHLLLQERQDNASLLPYSLPPNGPDVLRATGISTKQTTFTYGPPVGVGPYYPAGVLGTKYATADGAIDNAELAAQMAIMKTDDAKARVNSAKYNGLKTLEDYTKLYDGEWQPSSQPTGQYDGILTNYTQDLLFSMERLSFNPYAVSRLNPASDSLPFTVDDAIVITITGQTLKDLFTSGRLFYADHRVQAKLPQSPPPQYSPACDALFYICPSSGNFLPLAIRSGVGDLVYTPEDSPGDWLLAKIMFNVNDFFMSQFDHFARNHFVAEIVYEAAVRTLSDEHPVLAIMKRLLYGAFGMRPLALLILTRPGGDVDLYFGVSGEAAAQFSNDTYFNGYGGAFRSNWFLPNLQKRGLIDSPIGPPLKSFPFYEDACPIYDTIRAFTGSFVSSYYTDDAAITSDHELQSWVKEAQGPAKVIDFPSAVEIRSDLADLLAEVARLVSFSHHAVNLNQLVTVSATLPFHPTALYKPIPDAKGVTDVASYLPPLDKALGLIGVAANFARSLLANSNRSMIHMFDDAVMLDRMNDATRMANENFKDAMAARSEIVRSRGFDADGLSQGMPFVWQALDPGTAAWSLSI